MVDYIRILPQTDYDSGSEVSLMFDSVTEFTPNSTKKVTQYVTSEKLSITNNSVKTNPTLQMRGRVSKYPLEDKVNNLINGGNNLEGRMVSAHDILQRWYDQDTDLFIDAGYKGYSRYQLISFEPTEDGTDSLIFSLRFEKVRRTTYERILLIQNMSESKTLDGKPNTDGGKDQTSEDRVSQVTLAIENTSKYAKERGQESVAELLDEIGGFYDSDYTPSSELPSNNTTTE
ncbi:hypothetical protein NVP1084O_168 [Vibrio phage 1.084.O._10N.261.49.F5]|nr:hypothetical protein NVP1084O_168 [Vibrio phage 1.084.O._10N.261.49.F5]